MLAVTLLLLVRTRVDKLLPIDLQIDGPGNIEQGWRSWM
jgi:hypothetical protein